jgi:NAD(P)H-hydrate epimerase
MKALEQKAFESGAISLEAMMERAGSAIASAVLREWPDARRVTVYCGKGNNGGDAWVAARLLKEAGIAVTVVSPFQEGELSEGARKAKKGALSEGISVVENPDSIDPSETDLIIDAVLGFSLKGNPTGPAAQLIEQINCSKMAKFGKRQPVILSVDVPSGLEVHEGVIRVPAVRADATLALGLPKNGFRENPELAGRVLLGDLGIPAEIYRDSGIGAPDFRGEPYLKL